MCVCVCKEIYIYVNEMLTKVSRKELCPNQRKFITFSLYLALP